MDTNFPPLNYGALVAEAVRRRKAEHLTQRQLAALADVTQPTIWRFEKGDPHLQLSSVLAILRVLNLLVEPTPTPLP